MIQDMESLQAAPLVSVCIPTYRGATHLAAAIDSVMAQTFVDFELIVIDDDSPDATTDIVARYADPRLRYLRNASNLGPSANWNRCLQEARGKYFKLLPQDDLLRPDCLARQVAILERDTSAQIALVFCARYIIGPEGRVLLRRGLSAGEEGQVPAAELMRRCIGRATNLIGEPGGVLVRKELARQIGEFDATNPYVLDLDYWFRVFRLGGAYYLSEPLAMFRVSQGSWSVRIGAGQTEDFRAFIRRIAGNPDFKIDRTAQILGYIMAGVNTWLRLLFYRLYLK